MRNQQQTWWDPHEWTQQRALRREEWVTGTPEETMLLVADRRIPLIAGFIAGAGVLCRPLCRDHDHYRHLADHGDAVYAQCRRGLLSRPFPHLWLGLDPGGALACPVDLAAS